MATVTNVEYLELAPNGGIKEIWVTAPNTADAGDTVQVTLTDYGIDATGLLAVDVYSHSDSGAVLTVEPPGVSVVSGVLYIGLCGAANQYRACRIVGKSTPGDFS